MKSSILLILVLYSTLNIFCDGSQFVQKRLTWMEANKFCKDQNSRLACINPEDISNTDLQDVQNFWTATHTTFSSWIKDDGYLLGDPIGEEFVIPEDDIYTCQLLCTRYTHFAVKATKCLCFSGDSNTQTTGTVKAYESVEDSQLTSHLLPSDRELKEPCTYYICAYMFSTQFEKPDGISDKCFSTDRFLVICSSPEITIQHLQQQCKPLKDYRNQIRYGNTECKWYKVYFNTTAVCEGQANEDYDGGCNVAVQTIPNFVKGVGLTSSVNQDKIVSCYFGMLSTHNDIRKMTFSESTNCDSSYNFFCERDTKQSGLCNINPISIRHTSSEQSSTTTGKEGMKGMSTNVQSTWQDEKTSERITETQMESNNGITIGVSVSICIVVLILVGLLIVIYCIRNKAKNSRQNQSSNGSSFRNIAYESNPSNNTDNINDPNTYGSDYDYIREDEYSTIQSDTKNGGTNNDTRYPQYNKRLLPRPKHQMKQDTYYTGLDKSASSNVYDELEKSKKQDKDPQPRCNKPGGKSFDCNSNERSRDKSDTTKVNLNSQDKNYFILEKSDTALGNAQMEEGGYVDSAEGDYDHLNKKREKGSRDKAQGNLYAHTIQNSTGEKTYDTYDTPEGSKPVACIDYSAYDTLSHV